MLTTDEIDREIASRTREADAMSVTLVEMDSHPGLVHVRRYPPTGTTARRWSEVEQSMGKLWEDFGRLTSILDSARMVRARRSKPDDSARSELTRLLRERSLEVSRQRIPLAQRLITDPAETVVCVGVADTVDRMRTTYSGVAEFLDAVEAVNSLIAEHLGPSQKLLDQAGAAPPRELENLLAATATDPLSFTPHELRQRIRVIEGVIQQRKAELAALAAAQANYPHALAAAATQLEAVRDATLRAAQVRARAEQAVVTGPLPHHENPEPALRAELDSVAALRNPEALAAVRRKIDAALAVALQDDELAQGLLDRRGELKGRLVAYQAKAARLGLAEDRDLLACDQIAAGLLARKPCDLRAVTRAIADYQQLLVDKQGKTR